MEYKKIFNESIWMGLLVVIGAGLLSTIITSNEDLMGFFIYFLKLFIKNIDQSKIAEIIFLISRAWLKFTLIVVIIYALIYANARFEDIIRPPTEFLREIKHKLHSIKERIKYSSKLQRIGQIDRMDFYSAPVKNKSKYKAHEADMQSIIKSRRWPEDIAAGNRLIKEKIEDIISKRGCYTVTEAMKSIERSFDLSIKEKHQILDDIRSIISSSYRLRKLKTKPKEVKK